MNVIQNDPNQKLIFLKTVTLERSIFDPTMVKPLLKHILFFTTYGLQLIVMELQQFKITTFDWGHLVGLLDFIKKLVLKAQMECNTYVFLHT